MQVGFLCPRLVMTDVRHRPQGVPSLQTLFVGSPYAVLFGTAWVGCSAQRNVSHDPKRCLLACSHRC